MGARRSPNRRSSARAAPAAGGELRARLTRYAEAHDLALIFFEPGETFDHAIIGLIYGYGQEVAVLYDEGKVIAAMIAGGMSEEDAEEFFEFNTVGAYLGDATPRFLMPKVDDA